jgi:hypothetical protein
MNVSIYSLLLLSIGYFVSNQCAYGQTTDFSLGKSLTEHHVPLVDSKLYLDTSNVDFRPLISLQSGDWLSDTSDASFLVLALQKADSPTEKMQATFNPVDSAINGGTPLTLNQIGNWETTLSRTESDEETTSSYSFRATRGNEIIYLTANLLSETQIRALLGSLVLSQEVTSSDPFSELPLSPKLPADFPLQFAGKVPILGFAFQGDGETMVGLDDGAMMSDLLRLDEAAIRSQVGQEATVRIDGDDKLIFGYEEKDGIFQVFGIRAIGDQSVALMGQGEHTARMEEDLLTLLEGLEAR